MLRHCGGDHLQPLFASSRSAGNERGSGTRQGKIANEEKHFEGCSDVMSIMCREEDVKSSQTMNKSNEVGGVIGETLIMFFNRVSTL